MSDEDAPVVKGSTPDLTLGLMTIGSFSASHDPSKPNPDFETLTTSRHELYTYLSSHLDNAKSVLPQTEQEWELSMGMSADFKSYFVTAAPSPAFTFFGRSPKILVPTLTPDEPCLIALSKSALIPMLNSHSCSVCGNTLLALSLENGRKR
jgi:hypothetical protein